MNFRTNLLKLLKLLQWLQEPQLASSSWCARIFDFKTIFGMVMLVAVCSSCASDSDFSSGSAGLSPATATPSTNPLVNAVVTSPVATNPVATKATAPKVTTTKSMATDSTGTNAMDVDSTNGMENLDDKYRLAIGDSINFQVIEDDNDPQPIDVTDSGDVQFPYIGRFPAEGKTCSELAQQLQVELQKKYFYHATVIISVKSMASKGVIYLMGGVKAPGPLELPRDDVLTISRAVLRAGGFDDFADQKHVQVTRKGPNGTNEVFIVNVGAVLDKNQVQEDRQAEPGDLIYVPEKTFRY